MEEWINEGKLKINDEIEGSYEALQDGEGLFCYIENSEVEDSAEDEEHRGTLINLRCKNAKTWASRYVAQIKTELIHTKAYKRCLIIWA